MKTLLLLFSLLSSLTFAQIPQQPTDISPLLIGESLPEATLLNPNNQEIILKDIIKEKPTVIMFYRGGWCPYCNAHLAELQGIDKAISEAGYNLVAISPDVPANISTTENEKDIEYELYSDEKGELIKTMGIAYVAPDHYKNMLFEKSNGINTGFLPVPSVFVVDQKGTILFEYINPDFTTRLSAKLLLAVLKNINVE